MSVHLPSVPSVANEPSAAASAAAAAAFTAQSSQTDIKVENVIHHWTIRNFSHCYSEYLENFVHLIKGEDNITWSVKVYPKGNGDNNKDFVFLCLNRLPTQTMKFRNAGFKSRFIMKNAENKEIEMRVHPNPSHSDYVAYIKRDVLFPQIQPQDIVQVTVIIDVAVDTVTTSQSDPIQVPDPQAQLATDYARLLREGLCADFTIQVGQREFKVHKSILATRSTVLAAMLSHDTEESQKGCMQITDLDPDVVAEMLEYIYSGTSSRMSELGPDLLIAADKYSLAGLKLQCEKALATAVTTENAAELLILADLHHAPKLRMKALQFVTEHSYQVTQSPGWAILLEQHKQLVTEVVQNFSRPSTTNVDVLCLN